MFQTSYQLATHISRFVTIHHKQIIFDRIIRWNVNIEKLLHLNHHQKALLVQQ